MVKWNDAKKILPALEDGVFSRAVLIRVRYEYKDEEDEDNESINYFVASLHYDEEFDNGEECPVYFLIDTNGWEDDETFDYYEEQCMRAYLKNVTHWAEIEEPEGVEP